MVASSMHHMGEPQFQPDSAQAVASRHSATANIEPNYFGTSDPLIEADAEPMVDAEFAPGLPIRPQRTVVHSNGQFVQRRALEGSGVVNRSASRRIHQDRPNHRAMRDAAIAELEAIKRVNATHGETSENAQIDRLVVRLRGDDPAALTEAVQRFRLRIVPQHDLTETDVARRWTFRGVGTSRASRTSVNGDATTTSVRNESAGVDLTRLRYEQSFDESQDHESETDDGTAVRSGHTRSRGMSISPSDDGNVGLAAEWRTAREQRQGRGEANRARGEERIATGQISTGGAQVGVRSGHNWNVGGVALRREVGPHASFSVKVVEVTHSVPQRYAIETEIVLGVNLEGSASRALSGSLTGAIGGSEALKRKVLYHHEFDGAALSRYLDQLEHANDSNAVRSLSDRELHPEIGLLARLSALAESAAHTRGIFSATVGFLSAEGVAAMPRGDRFEFHTEHAQRANGTIDGTASGFGASLEGSTGDDHTLKIVITRGDANRVTVSVEEQTDKATSMGGSVSATGVSGARAHTHTRSGGRRVTIELDTSDAQFATKLERVRDARRVSDIRDLATTETRLHGGSIADGPTLAMPRGAATLTGLNTRQREEEVTLHDDHLAVQATGSTTNAGGLRVASATGPQLAQDSETTSLQMNVNEHGLTGTLTHTDSESDLWRSVGDTYHEATDWLNRASERSGPETASDIVHGIVQAPATLLRMVNRTYPVVQSRALSDADVAHLIERAADARRWAACNGQPQLRQSWERLRQALLTPQPDPIEAAVHPGQANQAARARALADYASLQGGAAALERALGDSYWDGAPRVGERGALGDAVEWPSAIDAEIVQDYESAEGFATAATVRFAELQLHGRATVETAYQQVRSKLVRALSAVRRCGEFRVPVARMQLLDRIATLIATLDAAHAEIRHAPQSVTAARYPAARGAAYEAEPDSSNDSGAQALSSHAAVTQSADATAMLAHVHLPRSPEAREAQLNDRQRYALLVEMLHRYKAQERHSFARARDLIPAEETNGFGRNRSLWSWRADIGDAHRLAWGIGELYPAWCAKVAELRQVCGRLGQPEAAWPVSPLGAAPNHATQPDVVALGRILRLRDGVTDGWMRERLSQLRDWEHLADR